MTNTNTHETNEVPMSDESRTRSLVQPVTSFKKPKKKGDTEISLSVVRFVLPDGETVDVPAGSYIVLGRQQGNDRHVDFDLSVLYGPESGISRTHAIMQITTTSVFIRDFDSTNGTFLNGSELYAMRDYPVNDGDELKVGNVTMRVLFIN